ncbi:MAG: ISAzo13 family transposase [Euryarchaeota archaeon]|nr:ISAzo13 family transposase [Euryarchaeota archaeon]
MENIAGLQQKIEIIMKLLDEKERRLLLGVEAKSLGHGGIKLVSEISGVSQKTISRGIKELKNPNETTFDSTRQRKTGGGRKRIEQTQTGIKESIEEMFEAYTKGDPENPILWTSKSLRHLETALREKGFVVDHSTVSRLLKEMGYRLQGNRKDLAINESHLDRDAQFNNINETVKIFIRQGSPVLSVDAKKKENIVNLKNSGQEHHKKGNAPKVLDHDFPIKELGKATPYGIYDIFRNHGFVSVGVSSDTAEFAVESLRKWQEIVGAKEYSESKELLIVADSGGSNGYRTRLWKAELQRLSNELEKKVTVLHLPPGTSKWNKIEHRLFSFISKNWRGKPLIRVAVIVELIGLTKPEKGLKVDCVIDTSTYPRGIKVSDEEFDLINIKRHEFHGEWNYTISPQSQSVRKMLKF